MQQLAFNHRPQQLRLVYPVQLLLQLPLQLAELQEAQFQWICPILNAESLEDR